MKFKKILDLLLSKRHAAHFVYGLSHPALSPLQLYYVGHSMGTTSLFVMLDLYPERASSIEHVLAVAPVTTVAQVSGYPAWFIPITQAIMNFFELVKNPGLVSPKWIPLYCPTAMVVLMATGYHRFDGDTLPTVLTFSPSSSSTRTLLHYIRCMQRDRFCSFDGTRDFSLAHTR